MAMKGIQLKNYDLDIVPRKDSDGLLTHGLVLGDILAQNQAIILYAHKGEIKEAPTMGCGIADMLLDHDPTLWKREIRENLEMDGQKVSAVRITPNGLEIHAKYL